MGQKAKSEQMVWVKLSTEGVYGNGLADVARILKRPIWG
jgi:hypothetical protein